MCIRRKHQKVPIYFIFIDNNTFNTLITLQKYAKYPLYKQKIPRKQVGCYLILYTALLINPFTHSFVSESPNKSNRA